MGKDYYEIYKKIGQNIKKLRIKNQLTQQEFSKLIGISCSYLTKIEAPNCDKKFSLELLIVISDKLNIDIKELFNFDEEKVT
ncbi:helix-turn-helix domain-containing protein [Desulfofalx alkaliphila]|uniref:helix-turn-helix domain-containing protein n=1 Tax=Desulfofalx alkaliphila TaxID=105483 RepID=UPI0004E184CB|nr:helix-turn-helix transcriptional regulator [Desulfofalx alkaliphila]